MPSERPGNPIIHAPYQTLTKPKPTPKKQKPNPPYKPPGKNRSNAKSDVLSGGGYNPPDQTPGPPHNNGNPAGEVQDQPKHIKKNNPTPFFTDASNRSRSPAGAAPSPKLQKHGINRSVSDFNDMMDQGFNLFQQRYNRLPSPGFLYDLARSPRTPDDLHRMFDVPDSDMQATAGGSVRKEQQDAPHNHFVQRPDGMIDRGDPLPAFIGSGIASGLNKDGPLDRFESALKSGPIGELAGFGADALLGGHTRQQQAAPTQLVTPPAINKKYPMVSQASLPIPGWDTFWDAAREVQKLKLNPDQTQIIEHGKTLPDYQYHMHQAEIEAALKAQAPARAKIQTVKAGLEYLKRTQPEFFGMLEVPKDGIVNADWGRQINLFKRSPVGAQRQVEFDAKQANLSPHDYVQAWRNKQNILKKYPQFYQMVAPMPLDLLVHPQSFTGSASDLAKHLTAGVDWSNPLTYALGPLIPATHILGNAAGLGMELVGSSVDQYKAYATVMRVAMQHGAKAFSSDTKTAQQMKNEMRAALTNHPTWAGIAGINLPKWLDQTTNLVGDILLFGKPKYTGEFVPLGDTVKAANSRYLNGMADLAWRQLKHDGRAGVARAAQFLESETSRTAEDWVAAVAKDVHEGNLSRKEFQVLTQELYANGTVEYGARTVGRDGILHSLSAKNAPTRNVQWQHTKGAIRDAMNRVDATLRQSTLPSRDSAVTFVNQLRNEFMHASPKSEFRNFFEPKLPQRIYDYAKNTFKEPNRAEAWRNEFVIARTQDNVQGMKRVFDDMKSHYDNHYVTEGGKPAEEPFKALFHTEAPSRGYFPGGGVKDVDGVFGAIAKGSRDVNDWALRTTARHRTWIVAGDPIPGVPVPGFGMVLYQKHAVADSLRRIAADGGVPFLKFNKDAMADFTRFAKQPGNEQLFREWKIIEKRSSMSETRYESLSKREDSVNFNTGDPGLFKSKTHMSAAGGYLRNMFGDDAIGALQQSSKANLEPLEKFIAGHPDYRSISLGRSGYLSKAKEKIGELQKRRTPPATREIKEEKLGELRQEAYKEQAAAMYRRYQEIVDSAKTAGIDDPVTAIQQIMHSAKGQKLDEALGSWVKDNRVDFPVKGGLVTVKAPNVVGKLDDLNQRYIGFLMGPNKANRQGMFNHILAKSYKHSTDAGWDKDVAARYSLAMAEKLVAYHMFDFANMLKVEQDLRHFSYFATKHRLYWKWVANQVWRRPGLSVVANDFQHNLDYRGNLNFKLFGQRFAVPVPRLLWLNSLDLPEISTPYIAAEGFLEGMAKGKSIQGSLGYAWSHAAETSGNIITRDDQTWYAAYNLLRAEKGWLTSYQGATAGMSSKQQAAFYRSVNHYQADHFLKYGHAAPESQVTKYALAQTMLFEGTRANFAVPVWIPGSTATEKQYNGFQKMSEQYSKITDSRKRGKFLDDHPAFQEQILQGSKDPRMYAHNKAYFTDYRNLKSARDDMRDEVLNKAHMEGWTVPLEARWRKAGRDFNKGMQQLLLRDAATWKGSPSLGAGKVSEGQIIKPGPFGHAIEGNPFLTRKNVKEIFPGIGSKELQAKTIGGTVVMLQDERNFMNSPKGKATWKDKQAYHDRLNEINERLSHFQGYPKTAAEKYHAKYFDQVNAFRDKRDKWRDSLQHLSSDKLERAHEELRAYIDSQDHPLPITVGGKTIMFPSPVRVGFELLPPGEKEVTVDKWASDNWEHLPAFAKKVLTGVQPDKTVSKGWLAYKLFLDAYAGNKHSIKRVRDEFGLGVKPQPFDSLDITQKAGIITQIDGHVGASGKFITDYNFSQKPMYQRLNTYRVIQNDQNWQDLLSGAKGFMDQIKSKGYTGNEKDVKVAWRLQAVPQLKTWLAQQNAGFQRKVALMVKQNANFWNTLISP